MVVSHVGTAKRKIKKLGRVGVISLMPRPDSNIQYSHKEEIAQKKAEIKEKAMETVQTRMPEAVIAYNNLLEVLFDTTTSLIIYRRSSHWMPHLSSKPAWHPSLHSALKRRMTTPRRITMPVLLARSGSWWTEVRWILIRKDKRSLQTLYDPQTPRKLISRCW